MQIDDCLGRNRQLLFLVKERGFYMGMNASFVALIINFGSNLYMNDDIAGVFAGCFFSEDCKKESCC